VAYCLLLNPITSFPSLLSVVSATIFSDFSVTPITTLPSFVLAPFFAILTRQFGVKTPCQFHLSKARKT
jgi:hypothetical protein